MNQRSLADRLLSPAGFGLVLLLFIFPFVTVSCGTTGNGTSDATFTGVDLVLGEGPDVSVADDLNLFPEATETIARDELRHLYAPEPLARTAALLVFAGLLFTQVSYRRTGAWLQAAAATLAAALLAVSVFVRMPARVDEAKNGLVQWMNNGGVPVPDVEFTYATRGDIAFWVAMAILVGLAAWQAKVGFQAKRPASVPLPPKYDPPVTSPVQVGEPGTTPSGDVPRR